MRHPIEASTYFSAQLVNLGVTDARLDGIFMPEAEVGVEPVGLSEQFLSNAAQYASRYSASDDTTGIFRNALAEIEWAPRGDLTILDMGTGSGANSVVPCLRIFDKCTIVATDLSPELLGMLRHYVDSEQLGHRVACVCTDAMRNHFKPEAFDMVVGVAILHHLIDPQTAIDAAFKALKPGGIALFMEPFEGFSLIGNIFKRIMREADQQGLALSDSTRTFLKAIVTDLAARTGVDKSDIRFRYMDDKWLFTRTYIDRAAMKAGFNRATIVPTIATVGRHYRFSVEVLLRCSGMDPSAALPDWAWAHVDELDETFSPEMKRDALLEGTIVFYK